MYDDSKLRNEIVQIVYALIHSPATVTSPDSVNERQQSNTDITQSSNMLPITSDPLFDPCVGNQCDVGEVCESLKNEKVVCILDKCNTPTEAFQNMALGKMCGQSSTYNNEHAEYAVDGLTNTAPHTQQDQSPYWWVDLGNIYNIIRIEVINRWSSGYRLHDLDITFGTKLDDMSMFSHYTGPAVDNEHLVFHRSRYTEGRYVKLTITQGPGILHVSEVFVIAYPVC
ncbi:uncharacterized protein [Mytilus edulis]|uniref:uncharacterized protein n=1 Tax=Mytilus edulis TaxID=6550 RepID=UPI0039EFA277